jgi:hypothetical protein
LDLLERRWLEQADYLDKVLDAPLGPQPCQPPTYDCSAREQRGELATAVSTGVLEADEAL